MRLPITVMDIINLPMDEFNDLLSKHELTEEQLTLCRDIRRRGKNKVLKELCLYFHLALLKQSFQCSISILQSILTIGSGKKL